MFVLFLLLEWFLSLAPPLTALPLPGGWGLGFVFNLWTPQLGMPPLPPLFQALGTSMPFFLPFFSLPPAIGALAKEKPVPKGVGDLGLLLEV
jgi:hypothetical protein